MPLLLNQIYHEFELVLVNNAYLTKPLTSLKNMLLCIRTSALLT
ncbi:hypothetical protein QW060_24875 [Myroides ceti]|uniref:Maturase K n=1 Tax=Paenimyroides ceti TaxID=395087 RepID=A0ABT8CZV4_9FLAO|nr:hypothetical protein [Paenimyroides ceti]MDN3710120.1 hypothetical protein [Paenimyroides ceti]